MFSDGTHSQADASAVPEQEWVTKTLPEGSMIKRYELMQSQIDSCLHGIKFLDKKGKVLLAGGDIENPLARNSTLMRVKEHMLRDDEKLVGFKSGQRKYKDARHYDLQFVVGRSNY